MTEFINTARGLWFSESVCVCSCLALITLLNNLFHLLQPEIPAPSLLFQEFYGCKNNLAL